MESESLSLVTVRAGLGMAGQRDGRRLVYLARFEGLLTAAIDREAVAEVAGPVEAYSFGDDLLAVKVGEKLFAWIPLGDAGWPGQASGWR